MKKMILMVLVFFCIAGIYADEAEFYTSFGLGGFFQTSGDLLGTAMVGRVHMDFDRVLTEITLIGGSAYGLSSVWINQSRRYHLNFAAGYEFPLGKRSGLVVKGGPSLMHYSTVTDVRESGFTFGGNFYLAPVFYPTKDFRIEIALGTQVYLDGNMDHHLIIVFGQGKNNLNSREMGFPAGE